MPLLSQKQPKCPKIMCISSDYGLTALLGAIGAQFGPLWAYLEATEKENGIFSADFYPTGSSKSPVAK